MVWGFGLERRLFQALWGELFVILVWGERDGAVRASSNPLSGSCGQFAHTATILLWNENFGMALGV